MYTYIVGQFLYESACFAKMRVEAILSQNLTNFHGNTVVLKYALELSIRYSILSATIVQTFNFLLT